MKVSFGEVKFSSPIKVKRKTKATRKRATVPLKSILKKRPYQPLGDEGISKDKANNAPSNLELGHMSLSSLVWSGEASSLSFGQRRSISKQPPTPLKTQGRFSEGGIVSSSRIQILQSISEDSSESTLASTTTRARRRLSASSSSEPPSVRLRRKRRARGENEKENSRANKRNKNRDHIYPNNKPDESVPTWRKGIMKALEEAGDKKRAEYFVIESQLRLILEVWSKLEETFVEEASNKKGSKEDQICELIAKLALDLELSHRKLVRFLKGDAEQKLTNQSIDVIQSRLNDWLKSDHPPHSPK